MIQLARCLDLEDVSFEGLLSCVTDLRTKLGIPDTLAAIGINDKQTSLVAKMALADPAAGGNPIALTEQDYAELFTLCLGGKH